MIITNLETFEKEFNNLGEGCKTSDIDKFNKELIKKEVDVSFLRDVIAANQKYHRTYFQVSLGRLKKIEAQLDFIENNFDKLKDWWHVDQLPQFLSKDLSLELASQRAKSYVKSDKLFARRWGYVIFMPRIVKYEGALDAISKLFKNDEEYYVQMAQAWLISDLAVYDREGVFEYLSKCDLDYKIVGKAIQKICDSFRIDDDDKIKFKELRKRYK